MVRQTCCLLFFAYLLQTFPAGATIYYVTLTGNDANPGNSWTSAFATIQAAVTASAARDSVFIEGGYYFQTEINGFNHDLNVFGSFAGWETSPAQRNFFSGTVLDGATSPLVVNTTASPTTALYIQGNGAHVLFDGVQVSACVNYNNAYSFAQGGAALIDGDSVIFWNCSFFVNGAAIGGGICLVRGSVNLYQCSLSKNIGGALVVEGGSAWVSRCYVAGNTGGAIKVIQGSLIACNNVFDFNSNSDNQSAAGVGVLSGNALIANNTFYRDTLTGTPTNSGSALFAGARAVVDFQNNIVWSCGNGAGNIIVTEGNLVSTYNAGQDMSVGNSRSGNITPPGSMGFVDSTLANPNGLQLTVLSPAVNAGDSAGVSASLGALDAAGEPRYQACRIDIGAYESSWDTGKTIISMQPFNDTICSGEDAIFSISTSGSPAKYQWETSANGAIWSPLSGDVGDTLVYGRTLGRIAPTFLRCLVVGTGVCASADTSSEAMLSVDRPVAILSAPENDTVCSGSAASFDLGTSGTDVLYRWQSSPGDPHWSDMQGANRDSLSFISPDPAMSGVSYRCIVSSGVGCGKNDTSAPATLVVRTPPEAFTLGNDTLLCTGDTLLLSVSIPDPGVTFAWQNGSTVPALKVYQAGNYSLSAYNACGTVTSAIDVQVQDCTCVFYVPGGFTPNGDGKNDVFKPLYHCLFADYFLRIFNRWGQLLFTSQGTDQGWDGNSGGRPQPNGTYIWEIRYKDVIAGREVVKEGTVVLAR